MVLMIRTKSGAWREAQVLPYPNEAQLQNLLYESPLLIPSSGPSDTTRMFISEAGLPGSGSTDLVGVSSNGNIYLVECKLATNPEIRRKVIGQILEYAAFLWGMSYSEFDGLFAKRSGKQLEQFFKDKCGEDWSSVTFQNTVSQNLKDGSFYLIIAVDRMNEQLEEVIGYLGRPGANVRLQAVELQLHAEGDTEILAPRLYGQFVSDFQGAVRGTRSWDYASFFEDARRKLNEEQLGALENLHRHFSDPQLAWLSWGRGATLGSFSVHVDRISKRSMITVTSDGKLVVNFGQLNETMPPLSFAIN
jgi:hypothetical protein